MNDFAYLRVDSVAGALGALQRDPEAMVLAGGTTVVDLLREGVFAPAVVVDIGALPLREIRVEQDFISVGALVANSDLAWNPVIRAMFPVVSQALLSGASGQIRNMASVGGNLLQRTRCPYDRDLGAACNKRIPGSGCAALEGFNRSHAVLGGSDQCIATHPSDFAVALTALDARVHVNGPAGERDVPITEFYRLPGNTPEQETELRRGELILAVRLPHSAAPRRSLYLKVRDRQSFEFALASAAVAAEIDAGGLLRQVGIALGGVGTRPWRARAAEQALEGRAPSAALFASAADAALADAQPRRHNAFKVPLAKRTLVAALEQLVLPA
jgi:xanthine dehydrogenase YagS FAD-binding subunit